MNARPGRLLLFLGLALAVLGVAGYVVQVAALHHLTAPWYMPGLATLGAILIAWSIWQARSVWRILILLFVVLLAAAEWAALMQRLPDYTGPVAVGQPFPAFTTARADGTPFTHRDLDGDQSSVLVFFRGRW